MPEDQKNTGVAFEELFYLGHEHIPCPYLPDKDSSLLVIAGTPLSGVYHYLMDRGYRRQGMIFYRPDCPSCTECQVLRIPVHGFSPSSSQKRIQKKGRSIFRSEFGPVRFTPDRFRIYRKFIRNRFPHRTDPVPEEYKEFFLSSCMEENTMEHRLYAQNRLVGIGILDLSGPALSSVYFYFDPDYNRYSPGVYSVLQEIEYAKTRGLDFYYPGYYIEKNASMNYKIKFRPGLLRRRNEESWRATDEPVKAIDL